MKPLDHIFLPAPPQGNPFPPGDARAGSGVSCPGDCTGPGRFPLRAAAGAGGARAGRDSPAGSWGCAAAAPGMLRALRAAAGGSGAEGLGRLRG